MRKNIPITNKFKQTFNIFRKGASRLFNKPIKIITHSSRLVKFRTARKALYFSLLKPKRKICLNKEELVKKKSRLILRLYASENAQLSFAELEAARRSIKRAAKRALKNKIYLRAYPFLYLTRKPSEVRMGKGKGVKLRDKVCPVHYGKIIFELKQVPRRIGIFALSLARKKLSIRTQIVKKMFMAKHRRIRMYQKMTI